MSNLIAAANAFPGGPILAEQPIRYGTRFITDEDLAQYTVTAVSTGTAAVRDAEGGGVLVSGAATTDDSGSNIQFDAVQGLIGTSWSEIRWQGGVQLSDATESDLFMGFAIADTSLIASAPNDQIGFRKADGSTSLVGFVRRDGSDVGTVTIGAMADGVRKDLSFLTTRTFTAFYDGKVEIGRVEHTTNPITEELMASSFAFQSGNNVGTKTAIWWYDVWEFLV